MIIIRKEYLAKKTLKSINDIPKPDFPINKDGALQKIGEYTLSPIDWRDEILYFLLVDRFSDEIKRPPLNRNNISQARPLLNNRDSWHWGDWAKSGAERFQGGNLKGLTSRLDYLKTLGISTIWLSPVFKQRSNLDTYHGYGIQDFLEVDPRFGTKEDLVNFVDAAHQKGIRVIMDIIINHSGYNFNYTLKDANDSKCPTFKQAGEPYSFGFWLDKNGNEINNSNQELGPDDAIWPEELQNPDFYTRRGTGNLANGDINDKNAEHKLSDFYELRDFKILNSKVLEVLLDCYKYWISLCDIDGFRIDTLKHVPKETVRYFCSSIKEYAAKLGKTNFILIGEIAGGDNVQASYLDSLEKNLDATLDIGELRMSINNVAKGIGKLDGIDFFKEFDLSTIQSDYMHLYRLNGDKNIVILDDHDHVFGAKTRFAYNTQKGHVLLGIALLMFSPGIPCLYYGTEQELSGPSPDDANKYLPNFGSQDTFLREAMFGPLHPLKHGIEGRDSVGDNKYDDLPGFGPFGTCGSECFDQDHHVFRAVSKMTNIRKKYAAIKYGRLYQREISYDQYSFSKAPEDSSIVAWSRILDCEEIVCSINRSPRTKYNVRMLIDNKLNTNSTMTCIFNSKDLKFEKAYEIKRDGFMSYIQIDEFHPISVMIFSNT